MANDVTKANNARVSPLSGIRVLDLSRLLPGPYCTQILSDLGAQVIKIEDSLGDYARYYPPLADDGNSAFFHAINRGKLSVKLDLKLSEDREKFLKLLSSAQVLVESFRPGIMKKLNLEPNYLLSLFPKLVICCISGYGQTGPDSLKAGHDSNYLARSGVLSINKNPQLLPVQVADIAGGGNITD
jgi:alpha-methylacyl-CoA racemase